MVAICGGGDAAPLSGYKSNVVITSAAIEGAMVLAGFPEAAAILAPVIAGVTYNAQNICDSDPPADPGLVDQDIVDALQLANPLVSIPAQLKIRDWFLHWYWGIVCKCVAGSTPLLTPGNLPNVVSTNPGISNGAPTTPCWDVTKTFTLTGGVAHTNITDSMVPLGTSVSVTPPFSGGPATARSIPQGLTAYNIQVTESVRDATRDGNGTIYYFNSIGSGNGAQTMASFGSFHSTPESTIDFKANIPANTASWMWIVGNNQSNPTDWTIHTYFFCAGQQIGAPQSSCCPPDPVLEQLIRQVMGMVTLIQRQVAPFGYISGDIHASLSGSGELTVADLLGCKINPASIPADAGVAIGDPDTLWLDSWINWGNADGWSAREFLRSAPYLSLPSLAGQYTKIGYSLRPGLTVDITELVREQ